MMHPLASFLVTTLLLLPGSVHVLVNQHNGWTVAAQQNSPALQTLSIPPLGTLYHGVYPGGVSGEEDDIVPENVTSYERLVGKSAAWVYFSDNWYKGRSFPLDTATWIRSMGSIPFIRLMLRSSYEQNVAEPTFTLSRIASGAFDSDLRKWAQAARDFGSPLLVEYGTEVNGFWFSWNGYWNGGPDGPEKFRDAYRHIVQVMRDEGASNILWVFHVNSRDIPSESWNRLENYYPGDSWVDWIGVSVYGPMSPTDYPDQFRKRMDSVYPRLASLNATKPIVLVEFSSIGDPQVDQAAWAGNALADLTSLRWPRVIGFSWWNEPPFRLQDNPAAANAFKNYVGLKDNVLGAFAREKPQTGIPGYPAFAMICGALLAVALLSRRVGKAKAEAAGSQP